MKVVHSNFEIALNLSDDLQPHNRKILLETLSQAVPVKALAKVLYKSKAEDQIFKTILELNPSENENQRDTFFNDFLFEVKDFTIIIGAPLGQAIHQQNSQKLRELRASMVEYVLVNGSERRKEILQRYLKDFNIV